MPVLYYAEMIIYKNLIGKVYDYKSYIIIILNAKTCYYGDLNLWSLTTRKYEPYKLYYTILNCLYEA